MPMIPTQRIETYEQWRARMLAETSAFIEWGLKHPEKVAWIPTRRLDGTGRFSERLKKIFWSILVDEERWPS